MRFGISHIIPLIFICLNFQLSYSQSSFRGKPCDDTEVRGYSGLPAWKNYGEWLSECDSLEDAWEDSIFAAISLEKKFREAEEKRIRVSRFGYSQDSLDIDLDDIWDQAIWEEITEVGETEVFEVEYITAVAGVRGTEAEDEALHYLYYRKSMKGPSRMELMEAYGKLRNKKELLLKENPDNPEIEKLNKFIEHLEKKIKNV